MEVAIAFLFAIFSVSSAFFPLNITGTTPAPVPCKDSQCNGKGDGNFEYVNPQTFEENVHYFLQCSTGVASCQPCWPSILQFSPSCNQCLYSKDDDCVTTQPWQPATTKTCPDLCPDFGPDFSGNVNDPNDEFQYVACSHGVTAGCIACPRGLIFNRRWNACLYKGNFKQIPPGREAVDYPPYGK